MLNLYWHCGPDGGAALPGAGRQGDQLPLQESRRQPQGGGFKVCLNCGLFIIHRGSNNQLLYFLLSISMLTDSSLYEYFIYKYYYAWVSHKIVK